MAIVMTRKFGNATVHVCDDDYKNCSKEEMQKRKEAFRKVLCDIYSKPIVRQRLAERYQAESEAKTRDT